MARRAVYKMLVKILCTKFRHFSNISATIKTKYSQRCKLYTRYRYHKTLKIALRNLKAASQYKSAAIKVSLRASQKWSALKSHLQDRLILLQSLNHLGAKSIANEPYKNPLHENKGHMLRFGFVSHSLFCYTASCLDTTVRWRFPDGFSHQLHLKCRLQEVRATLYPRERAVTRRQTIVLPSFVVKSYDCKR